MNGSKILFLGVAYKPNIDDARESPALEIMDITAHKGGLVSYHDPYIPSVETGHALSLHSIELTPETLHAADRVVITTNHSAFDVEMIQQHALLIVDLRNVIKDAGEDVFKL